MLLLHTVLKRLLMAILPSTKLAMMQQWLVIKKDHWLHLKHQIEQILIKITLQILLINLAMILPMSDYNKNAADERARLERDKPDHGTWSGTQTAAKSTFPTTR